ncbi:hypothetical protein ACFY0G_30185 [Streptomyces sp. NPDC001552]|uniref:hypothetical protein n=1 Tax=Streptomyces sp. NPDC001552 TaxID=3364587 RepID=UPI0036A3A911
MRSGIAPWVRSGVGAPGEHLLGPQDETVQERFTDLVRSRCDLRLGQEARGGRRSAVGRARYG